MAKKIQVVKPLLKGSTAAGEETKVIRIRIPLSKYEALQENAKLTGIKADQLLIMAADETDVFEVQEAKNVQSSGTHENQ